MVRRAVLHPDAERELDDAIAWIEGDRPHYGVLFSEAFDTAIERLLEYPAIGKRVRGDVRRWVLRRWRYVIVYSIEEYGIDIVAVAHQSRRPNYWRKRVRR
jgi:plasmid stabilization system protein ParE